MKTGIFSFTAGVLLLLAGPLAALEIIKAEVGCENSWLDATETFKKAKVSDDFYCGWFNAATMAGKDPARGKLKQIVVTYRDNDGTVQKRILEEKTFAAVAANTPGPTEKFTLGRAFWGDRKNYVEVTGTLAGIIRSGKSVSLTNGTLGVADPLPGKTKYLIVLYSIGGGQYVDSFKERSKFKGSMIDGSFDPIPLAKEIRSPFRGMELDKAVWQWSIDIPGAISHETGELSKAFLYIPPETKQLRGVVIGQFNMLERPIMEHPKFREYMRKLHYGCIWIAPTYFSGKPWNGNLDPRNPKHTKPLDAMFQKLADVSGYKELATIPFVGIGHSAMADFPYQLAAWKPERTIAGISYDGSSPGLSHDRRFGVNPTVTLDDLKRMEGIPFLQRTGGFGKTGNDRPLIVRSRMPGIVLTEISDPGSTHFDINDNIIEYMGRYLLKADKARGVGTLPLKKVSVSDGWYIDFWQGDNPPRVSAAPVGKFKPAASGRWGAECNWVFDAEHAKFHEAHEALYRGKIRQELAYIQNGKILPRRGDHFQVHPKFIPEKDGLRFKLKGGFADVLSEKNGKVGSGLVHGNDPENVRIYPSSGPALRIDDETVAVRFDRFGFNKSRRSHTFSFNAIHPGDSKFRRSVLQSEMGVPSSNVWGIRQFITFPELKDVKEGTERVSLKAVCNTGMPVEYFVDHGPAWIKDGELILTKIPAGAKYPVEVKVTAWQYGSSGNPKLRTAKPVVRTFHIIKK